MKSPIIYNYSIPTRFSDLDSYNHVNFKQYLLKIPFKIFDNASGKIYSQGRIDFTIVDVKTGRSTPITDKVTDLLFEEVDK